jgi:hypothetical protein
MPTVVWVDNNDKKKVLLTKINGEKMIISIGDFIAYEGRATGVRVENFTHKDTDPGPIGMTYLPWRVEEKRWATPSWSIMRGDARHLIASPHGLMHYGEHVDWNTMRHVGPCPEEEKSSARCLP